MIPTPSCPPSGRTSGTRATSSCWRQSCPELKEGILTIRAEHKESEEEQAKKGEYVRRERRYGSFARTFDVSGIDESGITAAYHNGILELTLPKQAPVVPQARQITIG